jgi:hypothetical protein
LSWKHSPCLAFRPGRNGLKDSNSTSEEEEGGEDEEQGSAKKERAKEKGKGYGHNFGGGARSRQTARITAGSARLKHPPQEPFKELGTEGESATEADSSEDKRIEELRATEAELEQLWIAERERELRLKRDQEAAEGLEDQRAVEKKLPEEVKQVAMETEEGVLKPGGEGKQAREGEEKEAETLKGERAGEREGLVEGEEREAETLKGERAGEREGSEDEPPREEQEDERMEEGQEQETEYESLELRELLTGPPKKELGGRQEVKSPELKPSEAERDIQLPDAPPPAPEEIMETKGLASESQDRFQGRET